MSLSGPRRDNIVQTVGRETAKRRRISREKSNNLYLYWSKPPFPPFLGLFYFFLFSLRYLYETIHHLLSAMYACHGARRRL